MCPDMGTSCPVLPRDHYSHSIVAGGFELMSYTTRFTPFTSLMIRVEIRASTSYGRWRPVGGHEVVGVDAADGEGVVVGAGVAHDADALHRQQHGEGLRRAAIEAGRLDFADDDRVGLAQRVEPLLGDFAEAADREAGAGERMPPDDVFRQAELQAEPADFVFEQIAQRFDQFEAQLRRQAADVVVELDRVGRAVDGGAAFDDVGVERALGEELGALDLASLRRRSNR